MSQRQLILGINLKMHQTPEESVDYYEAISALPAPGVQTFIAFPSTSLDAVTRHVRTRARAPWVAAQNMHWAPEGSFTGEISIEMLEALGVDLVLIGHAERRQYFHETDFEVNKKVQTAVAAGLRVLLCIGESAEDREYGVSEETLLRQLKIGLHDVPTRSAALIHIAYEPVWSIGSDGTPATPEAIQPVAAMLRAALNDRFGHPGATIPLLYGGSVTPANAVNFLLTPGIDGLLVGRAAWTFDGFRDTLAAVVRALSVRESQAVASD